jgi:hypothetical protein
VSGVMSMGGLPIYVIRAVPNLLAGGVPVPNNKTEHQISAEWELSPGAVLPPALR